MVVEILAANAIAISIRIISPAEDARVRDLARKEIAEPVDTFRGRPSLVSMSVQSMNNDNTTKFRTVIAAHGARLTQRQHSLPLPQP